MAWRCSGKNNQELVDNLFKNGLIKNESVKNAMMKVDRAHYCQYLEAAYEDSPQPIGHKATISAPHMHASATESLLPLLVRPGARVLDIGSGSGYLTAVLAEVVFASKVEGRVVGLEHIEALQEMGMRNMRKSERGMELMREGKVEFVVGDGRKGLVEDGKGWDAIHVGAAAVELHQELIEQLNSPGRIFIPVEDINGYGDQHIWIVDKDENGEVTKKQSYGVRYVPLTDAPTE